MLHHKEDRYWGLGDLEQAVRDALKLPTGLDAGAGPKYDVAFCSWGQHTAQNDFADRDLVITASIFREPDPVTEARGRAAADRPVEEAYTADELRALRHGEVLHDLLQGLSRGSLRNLEGDQAQECLIYLMVAANSGIKDDLPRLFPGCQILHGWGLDVDAKPEQPTWSANAERVYQYLLELSERENWDRQSLPDIATALGMEWPRNRVKRAIDKIEPALVPLGLRVVRGKGSVPSRVERDPDFEPPWDEDNPY